MSKCDISIHLDWNEFRQLETITGEVRVSVNQECACKGVVIESSWRTSGKGKADGGKGPAVKLPARHWSPGQEYRIPFSLPTGSGPCGYQGQLLSIDWTITAKAEIPWSISPKATESFMLLPGPVKEYYAGPMFNAQVAKKGQVFGQLASNVFLLCVAAISGYFAARYVWSSGFHFSWVLMVPSGVFVLCIGWLLFRVFRTVLSQRKLGKISWHRSPGLVCPGRHLNVYLVVPKAAKAGVSLLRMETLVQESVSYDVARGERRSKTIWENVFRQEKLLEGSRLGLRPGTPLKIKEVFEIPVDAPLSFDANHNSVTWYLRVQLESPRGLLWEGSIHFGVVPSRSFKIPVVGKDAPGCP